MLCASFLAVNLFAGPAISRGSFEGNSALGLYLTELPSADGRADDSAVLVQSKKVPNSSGQSGQTPNAQAVVINGYQLTQSDLREMTNIYGVTPVAGNYWYDTVSGSYGYVGGPASGTMYPGHAFGRLSANASNGNSGMFINGRELQLQEAYAISYLFGSYQPSPGRYWLTADGNMGYEGYNVAMGNIYVAAAALYAAGAQYQGGNYGGGSYGGGGNSGSYSGSSGGGDNFWSDGLYSAGNSNDQGQGYVSVPGYGPVGYGF